MHKLIIQLKFKKKTNLKSRSLLSHLMLSFRFVIVIAVVVAIIN